MTTTSDIETMLWQFDWLSDETQKLFIILDRREWTKAETDRFLELQERQAQLAREFRTKCTQTL